MCVPSREVLHNGIASTTLFEIVVRLNKIKFREFNHVQFCKIFVIMNVLED